MGKSVLANKWKGRLLSVSRYVLLALAGFVSYARYNYAASAQILSDLTQVKSVLGQLGPALSAMLFIVAGVFYAVGQMLPPDKKAHFHTAAINIIIGAIVVAALSFASTSLATSSTQVLSNFTVANSIH